MDVHSIPADFYQRRNDAARNEAYLHEEDSTGLNDPLSSFKFGNVGPTLDTEEVKEMRSKLRDAIDSASEESETEKEQGEQHPGNVILIMNIVVFSLTFPLFI